VTGESAMRHASDAAAVQLLLLLDFDDSQNGT